MSMRSLCLHASLHALPQHSGREKNERVARGAPTGGVLQRGGFDAGIQYFAVETVADDTSLRVSSQPSCSVTSNNTASVSVMRLSRSWMRSSSPRVRSCASPTMLAMAVCSACVAIVAFVFVFTYPEENYSPNAVRITL